MRADRLNRYGPPEVIDFEEVERPFTLLLAASLLFGLALYDRQAFGDPASGYTFLLEALATVTLILACALRSSTRATCSATAVSTARCRPNAIVVLPPARQSGNAQPFLRVMRAEAPILTLLPSRKDI
jgi:hypothetical protein